MMTSNETRCASADHLEQIVEIGVDRGPSQRLDNLVAYAEKTTN